MLTILASFAQEESRSASENVKWRIRNNFKKCLTNSAVILGYKLANGTFIIVSAEAEIIKMIFADFIGGMGKNAIVKKLISMGVPTKRGGNWSESVVDRMLRNEKYTGDMLLQKSFKSDHINKKKCINKGELPMYYVENSHEQIIDRDTPRVD
jgi:DNA invertase Pin-like site-specific DNA recombinase